MIELVEAFDKLDENLDTKVTLEEFLKYQVHIAKHLNVG